MKTETYALPILWHRRRTPSSTGPTSEVVYGMPQAWPRNEPLRSNKRFHHLTQALLLAV